MLFNWRALGIYHRMQVLPCSLLSFSLVFLWHLCISLCVCHCLLHFLWLFPLLLFVLCLWPTSKVEESRSDQEAGEWVLVVPFFNGLCHVFWFVLFNCAMTFDSLLSVSTPEVHFMHSSKMTSCIHDRHTSRLPLGCRDSLCLLRCLSEALHHLLHSNSTELINAA